MLPQVANRSLTNLLGDPMAIPSLTGIYIYIPSAPNTGIGAFVFFWGGINCRKVSKTSWWFQIFLEFSTPILGRFAI